ncbi:hypothetical protein HK102_007178, partial [Quaeritorhiza haematococci]
MSSRRKKPFSHKQKKAQLAERRARKATASGAKYDWSSQANVSLEEEAFESKTRNDINAPYWNANKIEGYRHIRNAAPDSNVSGDAEVKDEATVVKAGEKDGRNRLESTFSKLPRDVLEKKKQESVVPYERLPKSDLEVGYDNSIPVIDLPTRPPWSYTDTKDELDVRERRYFDEWLAGVYDACG